MERPRRIFTGLSSFGASGSPPRSGLRACVRVAVWLWVLDVAVALGGARHLGVPSLPRMHGLLAGLGFAVLLAVPLGIVVDGVLGIAGIDLSRAAERQRLLAAHVKRYLFEPDPAAQARRVGAILGGLPLLVLFCGLGFAGSKSVILRMAQPHFAAITIVAIHASLVLSCALLFPVTRDVGVRSARFLGATRAFGWLFGTSFGLLAALGMLALCALGLLVHTNFGTFALLPWRTIGTIAGALSIAFASFELCLGRPKLALAEGWLLGATCALAFVALCLLTPRGEVSRRSVFDTLDGRVGQAAMLYAFDFDRDGHLAVFGGGDCAEFNPNISPSALDVPNNGLDEDCDGADLDAKRLGVELRSDWPVPAGFPKRPPIVLITIDTFAASRMHALGSERVVTPMLDAFAARSALFRYAFAQGPSTRLSFPSLFTSRWDTQIKKRRHPAVARPRSTTPNRCWPRC